MNIETGGYVFSANREDELRSLLILLRSLPVWAAALLYTLMSRPRTPKEKD